MIDKRTINWKSVKDINLGTRVVGSLIKYFIRYMFLNITVPYDTSETLLVYLPTKKKKTLCLHRTLRPITCKDPILLRHMVKDQNLWHIVKSPIPREHAHMLRDYNEGIQSNNPIITQHLITRLLKTLSL